MAVKGTDGMSREQINQALAMGGKFVIYEYCISILIMTFKRPTDVYFIKPGESAVSKGVLWTVISVIFGWWGFPWGPIYTIGSLITNFGGGKDVTHEISMQNGFTPIY